LKLLASFEYLISSRWGHQRRWNSHPRAYWRICNEPRSPRAAAGAL